jgi:membrane protein required for colicin V production
MPIIDIIIVLALAVSVVIGFLRGFVKESISIATLLVAIWAALYFGPAVGDVSESWLSSAELQVWFGRILVFCVIMIIGGLIGWGFSKLARMALLGAIDHFLGALFGLARGIMLAALFVIGGQYAGFDNDEWWLHSRLLPHFEVVADWIKVMAPVGYEIIIPDGAADKLLIELPDKLPIESQN